MDDVRKGEKTQKKKRNRYQMEESFFFSSSPSSLNPFSSFLEQSVTSDEGNVS